MALDAETDRILMDLKSRGPRSQEERIALSNLEALLRVGSNHGDRTDSLTYIGWHLLILRDLAFPG